MSHTVVIDFQDKYGFSIMKFKDITQQETVFTGTLVECLDFYMIEKEKQDALDLEE